MRETANVCDGATSKGKIVEIGGRLQDIRSALAPSVAADT